jgi:hypothetical protein
MVDAWAEMNATTIRNNSRYAPANKPIAHQRQLPANLTVPESGHATSAVDPEQTLDLGGPND